MLKVKQQDISPQAPAPSSPVNLVGTNAPDAISVFALDLPVFVTVQWESLFLVEPKGGPTDYLVIWESSPTVCTPSQQFGSQELLSVPYEILRAESH